MSGEYEMAWTELTAEQVLLNQKKHKNRLKKHRKRVVGKYRTKVKDKSTRQKRVKKRVERERSQGIDDIAPSKVMGGFFKYQNPSPCKQFNKEEIAELNK